MLCTDDVSYFAEVGAMSYSRGGQTFRAGAAFEKNVAAVQFQ